MITTRSDFEDETTWEATVLAVAVPVMPLAASSTGIDLRTNTATIQVGEWVGEQGVEELRNQLLPLLFGAAWKVLDLALELAFVLAGLTPQRGTRWLITEKASLAATQKGALPGFVSGSDLWQALGILYANTQEIRHALVHRRVQVSLASRDLIAFDPNGIQLPQLSYEEQMAFCQLSQRLRLAILEGSLRHRVEADLHRQLEVLVRHHGVSVSAPSAMRPPVRVVDSFPEDGLIDVPRLLGAVRASFPGAYYVDGELHLADGRILTGELESAPLAIIKVDPAHPPAWLYFA